MLTLDQAVASLQERDCFIVEHIDGEAEILHLVRKPGAMQPGFYRAAVSAEYYKKREMEYWHDKFYTKRLRCPRWFHMKYSFEARHMNSNFERMSYEHLPIVEHSSLWDFYKYVGYDYKKKKYTTKEDEIG